MCYWGEWPVDGNVRMLPLEAPLPSCSFSTCSTIPFLSHHLNFVGFCSCPCLLACTSSIGQRILVAFRHRRLPFLFLLVCTMYPAAQLMASHTGGGHLPFTIYHSLYSWALIPLLLIFLSQIFIYFFLNCQFFFFCL